MKTFKLKFPIILLSITILTSCFTVASYIGDTLPQTDNMEVFYDAKDVKREYRVIGHISAPGGIRENDAKLKIMEKAKIVGADGVIIIGIDYTGGKDSTPFYKADAISYTN